MGCENSASTAPQSIGEQRGRTTWSRRAGTAEAEEGASNAGRGVVELKRVENSGYDQNAEQSYALNPEPNPAAGMGV